MIPLKTDRQIRSPILINHLLIVANILVALALVLTRNVDKDLAERIFSVFHLSGRDPAIYQFITYQFLHSQQDIFHLGFNMLFLWVFGQNLEDRLGRIGYLAFYLAGGVIAGVMHVLFSDAPVIGASGAVSAVTGAYLALFPRTRILVLWVFILITWFQIPAMWFIGFAFARDLFGALTGGGNIAYMAHLGGNVFGFLTGMTLLWTGILAHEPFDMSHLIKQAMRRRRFRSATARGDSPWRADAAQQARRRAEKQSPQQQALDSKRVEITRLAMNHQIPEATAAYEEALVLDPDFTMSQQVQLDVANQLASEGKHQAAARAYELFLDKHGQYHDLAQVKLMLGLLYARYLDKRKRARELVEDARGELKSGPYAQLADSLHEELAT